MIKAVIFDSDGMLSHGPRFSEAYAKEQNVPLDKLTPFFTGPFKDCLIGKTDLREELQNGWLERWQWKGNIDELLTYWFSVGDRLDTEVFAMIAPIRAQGIPCVLATNQEKYRTEYLSKTFGYDGAFDKVFSSAFIGHKKPNPEFFDAIFIYLSTKVPGLTREEVLFWDDDTENVDGAKAFGFTARQFVNASDFKKEMQEMRISA